MLAARAQEHSNQDKFIKFILAWAQAADEEIDALWVRLDLAETELATRGHYRKAEDHSRDIPTFNFDRMRRTRR